MKANLALQSGRFRGQDVKSADSAGGLKMEIGRVWTRILYRSPGSLYFPSVASVLEGFYRYLLSKTQSPLIKLKFQDGFLSRRVSYLRFAAPVE